MSLLLLFQGGGFKGLATPPVLGSYVLQKRVTMVPNNYGPTRRGAWLGPRVYWELVFVPDTGQGQIYTQDIDDTLDAFDALVKTHSNVMVDLSTARDEFVKSIGSVVGDEMESQDAFTKILSVVRGDSLDVSDASLLSILRFLLLSDNADVRDEQTKALFSEMGDLLASGDTFTKILYAVKDEQVTVDDAFSISKLLVLLLQENQDVFDELVKSLATVVVDSAGAADEQVKSISSVMSEFQQGEDAFVKVLSVVKDDSVGVFDQLLIVKLLILLLADSQDVSDEQVKTLLTQMTEALVSGDAFTKNLSVNRDDSVDISDTVDISKVVALILLELADLLSVADEFTKNLGVVQAESAGSEDAFTKTVSKVASDSVDFSDTVSVNKSIALVIDDLQNVLDGLTKIQSATMDDSAVPTEEFTKSIAKVAAEILDARDELDKIRGIVLTDNVELADAVTLLRTLSLLIQETVLIVEEMVKSMNVSMSETPDVVDGFVKLLLKNIQEQIEVFDEAIVSKFISLVLSEIQDVADAMVKSMSAVMADEEVNQDALVKLIAKVVSEQQTVEEELTLSVIRAIIIIAEYLDTMLTGQAELLGRLGGTNELMRRVSKIVGSSMTAKVENQKVVTKETDPMVRKPGTKGHRR